MGGNTLPYRKRPKNQGLPKPISGGEHITMNYTTQSLAVLFTTASTAVAMAWGSSTTCPQPVRERVITSCPSTASYGEWREPMSAGGHIGYVITTPFRVVSRALNGNHRLMPVGERFTETHPVHHHHKLMPVGEKKTHRKHTSLKTEKTLKPEEKSLKKSTTESSKSI